MDKHKPISDKARADGVLNGAAGPKAPPQKPLAAAQKKSRLSSGAAAGGAGRQARPVNPPGSSIKISCRNQAEIESKVIDIAGCAPPGGFIWDGLAGKETRWGKNSEGKPNQRWSFKGSEDHTRANLYDFRERCNRHYYVKGAKPHVQWKNREPKKPEKKIDLSLDFNKLPELTTHSYFIRKKVATPKAARLLKVPINQMGRTEDRAVIPIFAPDGRMISWQSISAGGDKKFKKGCPLEKGYHFRMEPMEPSEGGRVYVCEGVSTASSIAEITIKKYPVFCTFGKNNLEAVAEWLLEKYPERKVVMCLDYDIKRMLKPRLQHDRLIVLRPEKPGADFNDSQESEAEQQKLLNLKPVYEYEAPAEIPKTLQDVLKPPVKFKQDAHPLIDLKNRLDTLGIELRKNIRKDCIEIRETGGEWKKISDDWRASLFFKLNELEPESGAADPIKKHLFEDKIQALVFERQVDPFRDYLDGLKWDGKKRLAGFLSSVFEIEAESEKLAAWAGKSIFQAAVWRTYHPGHKHDEMIILRGPQGIGKSALLENLIKDKSLFSNTVCFIDSHKKIIETIHDKAVVEIAEMSGFRRAEVERIKNLITTRQDTVRLSYRRDAQDYPRRCVFVGTTNSSAGLPNDLTGLRRFIVIGIKDKLSVAKLIDRLKKERDQLWAEAVAAFKDGESARLPAELWAEAGAEAERHRSGDFVFEEEFLKRALETAAGGAGVNITTVLRQMADDKLIRDPTRGRQMEAAALLSARGFKRFRLHKDGLKIRIWKKAEK